MKQPKEELLPEITPLDTIKEYEDLSVVDRAKRQAAVTNYFVTYAINYSRRVKTNTDFLLNEVEEYKSVGNYTTDDKSQKNKEVQTRFHVGRCGCYWSLPGDFGFRDVAHGFREPT